MTLFRKKKDVCTCNSICLSCEENETTTDIKLKEGIFCVKILGSGCASCHTLYENTKSAVKKIGLMVEVEYITDLETIMKYGVMSMPALVVNEKVVSMGKVLKSSDIENILNRFDFC